MTLTETLSGLAEREAYHDFESGFYVLRVKTHGQCDVVAVIGHAATIINAGKFISATGVSDSEQTSRAGEHQPEAEATPWWVSALEE